MTSPYKHSTEAHRNVLQAPQHTKNLVLEEERVNASTYMLQISYDVQSRQSSYSCKELLVVQGTQVWNSLAFRESLHKRVSHIV